MALFDTLLKSSDIADRLDDIASSHPPDYLRRCFAETVSAPKLSIARIREMTVCAMVLDSILDDRHYDGLEPELIADWRAHYAAACAHMKETALAALHRAADQLRDSDPESAAQLDEIRHRLAGA
ncbi:MAG: hypothetical protein NVSMB10_06270 [Steroidobacteraceae bacterium]